MINYPQRTSIIQPFICSFSPKAILSWMYHVWLGAKKNSRWSQGAEQTPVCRSEFSTGVDIHCFALKTHRVQVVSLIPLNNLMNIKYKCHWHSPLSMMLSTLMAMSLERQLSGHTHAHTQHTHEYKQSLLSSNEGQLPRYSCSCAMWCTKTTCLRKRKVLILTTMHTHRHANTHTLASPNMPLLQGKSECVCCLHRKKCRHPWKRLSVLRPTL